MDLHSCHASLFKALYSKCQHAPIYTNAYTDCKGYARCNISIEVFTNAHSHSHTTRVKPPIF